MAHPYLPLLQDNRVFTGLGEDVLNQVLDAATLHTHAPDTVLVCQGDDAHAFHVLAEGRAKLLRVTPDGHQVLTRYVVAGQEFGLCAVLDGFTHELTVQAVTGCTSLSWPGELLARLMARHPTIGINALRVMVMRNQEIQRRYQELLTERVERRLAQALLRLADQAGRTEEQGILIDLPLKREDLADLTGTTLYTVSRTLSQWDQAGLVSTGRERVLLRKPDQLGLIASGVTDTLHL